MTWTWKSGTPRERADMIRSHLVACHGSRLTLCKLFLLTEEGARKILDGDDWRPEYEDHT